MSDIDDIFDPNFTEGLPSEVHLDYTREGMLGGTAHRHHVWIARELTRLRADLEKAKAAAASFLAVYDEVLSEAPDEILAWEELKAWMSARDSALEHLRTTLAEIDEVKR